jgi:hypothetical protein
VIIWGMAGMGFLVFVDHGNVFVMDDHSMLPAYRNAAGMGTRLPKKQREGSLELRKLYKVSKAVARSTALV